MPLVGGGDVETISVIVNTVGGFVYENAMVVRETYSGSRDLSGRFLRQLGRRDIRPRGARRCARAMPRQW